MLNLNFQHSFCSIVSTHSIGGTTAQGNQVYRVGSAIAYYYDREHIQTFFFASIDDAREFMALEMAQSSLLSTWESIRGRFPAIQVQATPREQLSYNQTLSL